VIVWCREECTYDLRDRGLCVITGQNDEDGATDSNGAGKSAFAMSAVWALTGRSEARREVTVMILLHTYRKHLFPEHQTAANSV